jgi:hypothetical protein
MEEYYHHMQFPMPFPYKSIYKESLPSLDNSAFVIISMFTSDNPHYYRCADRFAASCERYRLPYVIYEVPHVHNSISRKGNGDLSFTKANFICFNMQRFYGKDILYLDTDMFFTDYPERIYELSRLQYDFAIYNWLNDEHNEAYVPVNMKIEAGNVYSDFYVFSHQIGYYCPAQLLCSGGVQFYRNSVEARYLIESWQGIIASAPDSADDECLDFAYNNLDAGSIKIKPFWLDKAYLRLPWWPHVRPVILHTALPMAGAGRSPVPGRNNQKRFYPEQCRKRIEEFCFPTDYVIDTKNGFLLKFENEQLVDSRKISQKFWIYPEDEEISE